MEAGMACLPERPASDTEAGRQLQEGQK